MACCDIDEEELRIVMVGKTGTGKSALGNNLLGKKLFKSTSCGESVTAKCLNGDIIMENGKKFSVVDTPGLFDTMRSEEETRREIGRCITLSSPGPHVFFFVLKIGRFTEEEMNTIDRLIDIFGEKVVDRIIIIFTGKDDLEYEGKTIREFVQKIPPYLEKLIQTCKGRYAVINNRATGDDLKHDVDFIMDLVKATIKANGNTHYTGEMYEQAEKVLQAKMKAIEEEKNKKERELQKKIDELSEKEKDYDAKLSKMKLELQEVKNIDPRSEVRQEASTSDRFMAIVCKSLDFLGAIVNAVATYKTAKLGLTSKFK